MDKSSWRHLERRRSSDSGMPLFFLSLAREAEPELARSDQAAWLGRLEREHDKIREWHWIGW